MRRNDGGFIGTPEQMFLEGGGSKMAIAGPWKYRVERQSNVGTLYSKPGELAAHVAFTAGGGLAGAAGAALKPVAPAAPDVVLRLTAVPGQLKFDLTELTVAPGQLVEIVFTNPDAMQHNFVLGATGALEAVGDRGRQARAIAVGTGAAVRAGHAAGALLDQARRAGRDRDDSSSARPRPRATIPTSARSPRTGA